MKEERVELGLKGRDALVAEFVTLAAIDSAVANRAIVNLHCQPMARVYLHKMIVQQMAKLKKELE